MSALAERAAPATIAVHDPQLRAHRIAREALPGPHSRRWSEDWTSDELGAALRGLGVDARAAAALVRRYPAGRIRDQLRALPYRAQRFGAAIAIVDAIRTDRPLPGWMRGDAGARSEYRGPYAGAKPWPQTQLDVAQLLRKHGCDGIQWGVSERLGRASLLFERPLEEGGPRLLLVKIDVPLPRGEGERNAAFRAIYHHLKAKFDAAAFRLSDGTALVDLEREFQGHLLEPHVAPALSEPSAAPAPPASPVPAAPAALRPQLALAGSSQLGALRLREVDRLLVALLEGVGVARDRAEQLVAVDRARCEEQLAALPFRKRVRDRAAFVVQAIETRARIPTRLAELVARAQRRAAIASATVAPLEHYRASLEAEERLSVDPAYQVLPPYVRRQLREAALLEQIVRPAPNEDDRSVEPARCGPDGPVVPGGPV